MQCIFHEFLQIFRNLACRCSRAVLVLLSVSVLPAAMASAQTVEIEPDSAFFQRGTDLYLQHCFSCHGPSGDGQGPLAEFFVPRPPDFKVGNFKFVTSDLGEYPTRDDIIRAIDHGGISGTEIGIPSFKDIETLDRIALSEAVRVFAEIPEYADPFLVPPQPVSTNFEAGKALYSEHGCIDCHGPKGDGNGILSPDLVDSRGYKLMPANLTLGRFKGGNASENVWMRIYAGIAGTPMPSFGRSLSVQDIWSLVSFVEAFREE